MRVLLINPFYPLDEMPSPPLGLAYVAGAFLNAGAEVRILDLVVEAFSHRRIQQLMRSFTPDLVGITSVTMTYHSACEVLRTVKQIDPDVLTLMGGPHITFNARESLANHAELDMAVLGEGEATIAELCQALADGSNLKAIAGLAFKSGEEISITEHRPSTLDVTSLAPVPARHLLPMGRYKALGLAATMITSRGCPFQCIFCVGRKMSGAKVRYRNAVSVVDEMEHLTHMGFAQINIADDLFTAKKKHCFAICDEIIRRGLNIRWTAFSRANTISEDLLTRLKKAGCAHLSFGFESANDSILKTVEKRITPEQMLNAARLCQAAGIPGQASFITGLPGETPDTIKQTSDFADQIDKLGTSVGFHILAPFPGTRVRDHADELGIRILSNDWSRYTANEAVIDTPDASTDLLEEGAVTMQRLAEKQFAEVEQRVADGSASDDERQSIRKLNRMGIYYLMMMNDVLAKASDSVNDQTEIEQLLNAFPDDPGYDSALLEDIVMEGLKDGSITRDMDAVENSNIAGWHWASI